MSEELRNAVMEEIAAEISAKGPMTFARFMSLALYHPVHGYYAGGRVRIGGEGADFTTAPHVSALFGACLARFVSAADEALGRPDPFHLVEGGPGEGRLARDLLDVLARREPGLYARLRYVPEETSPALASRALRLLEPHREKVSAEAPPGYAGLHFSNELLDAFPFHRLRVTDGRVEELFVEAKEGRFAERAGVLGDEGLRALLPDPLPAGQWEAEVSPALLGWLGNAAERMGRGYFLFVDYGDTAGRLFGPHRPRGTVRAFRGHAFQDDHLVDPGGADLTASVDFTAVMKKAEALGLKSGPLLTQRNFLFALGVAAEAAEREAELDTVAAMELHEELRTLLFGGTGMGELFRALTLAKNAPLEGLPLDPEKGVGGL